jgi:hypothetical protein
MGFVTRDRSQGQSLALFWNGSDAVIIFQASAINSSQGGKVWTTQGDSFGILSSL